MKKEQLNRYLESLSSYIRNRHENVFGVPWTDTIWPAKVTPVDRYSIVADKDKSTLIRPEERSCRYLIFSPWNMGLTSQIEKIALAYAEDLKSYKKEYYLKKKLVPVILKGERFDTVAADTDFFDVSFHMCPYASGNVHKEEFHELFAEEADKGKLLLLVDGLDEMSQNCEKFLLMLFAFLEKFPETRLIITAHSYLYSETNQLPNLNIFVIEPMNRQKVCDFIEYWSNAVGVCDKKETDYITKKLFAPSGEYLHALTSSPGELAELLFYIKKTGVFPESKKEWFQHYAKRVLARTGDGWHFEEVAGPIAYELLLQKHNIFRAEMKEIVSDVLSQHNHDAEFEAETDPEKMVRTLEKCGLIRQRDPLNIAYYYPNRQLMEFLCASWIVKKASSFSEIRAFLCDKAAIRIFPGAISAVCLLIENDSYMREKTIAFLMENIKNEENEYYYSAVLFDLICQGYPLDLKQKKEAFRLMFNGQITEPQVATIREYLDEKHSENFITFITMRFQKDIKKQNNSEYSLAMAAIEIFRCCKQGKDPLYEAGEMIMKKEQRGIILGLSMISLIGWCFYSDVVPQLRDSALRLSDAAMHKMVEFFMKDEVDRKDVVRALQDSVLAGFFNTTLLNKNVFDRCIELMKREDMEARKLLACFPINRRSIAFCQGKRIYEIQEECMNDYLEAIGSKNVVEAYDAYKLCALTGAWSRSQLIEKYRELSALYGEEHKNQTDEEAKVRKEKLDKELRVLLFDSVHDDDPENIFVKLSDGFV